MQVDITIKGILKIVPATETEAFALGTWLRNNATWSEDGKDITSIDVTQMEFWCAEGVETNETK